jgi:hypothetical protein
MRKNIPWSLYILLIVSTFLTLQNNRVESAQLKTWQSDWGVFTKEYPKTKGDNNRTKQFLGKDVVWKGKISWVGLTNDEKKTATVVIEMNPSLRLGKFSTDTITISPNQNNWDAWAKLQKGQEVLFQTRLGISEDNDDPPVMVVKMFDGRNFVQIFTMGGKLLEVIQ